MWSRCMAGAHEVVGTGHLIWMVTCTLGSGHAEPEPSLCISSSVSLAGLCLQCSGRGRDWGLLRPGLWLSLGRPLTDTRLPGRARHCHHLPISSDQSSPISTSPIINTQCFLSKSGHDFSPVWMFEWAWGWKHLPTQDPSFLFRIHEYIFYHWRKTENKLSLLPIQKNIIPRIFYITSRSWH